MDRSRVGLLLHGAKLLQTFWLSTTSLMPVTISFRIAAICRSYRLHGFQSL
jgi:hypothetical protein